MTDLRATPAGIATVRVAGIDIAAVTRDEAVAAVLMLAGHDHPELVTTPNVDHIVMLERDHEYAAAYAAAALRVADGAPIVALARLLGRPLPERVTGVDLTLALLDACAQQGRSVFFFGGAPAHLERAVANVRLRHPELEIVGAASPLVDLDHPNDDELLALERVRAGTPDLLFVFLGAPKQEKWFARRIELLPPCVALGVGGTVDFLAGAKRRAPRWVQRIGCEWVWRLALDPRRLFERYVLRDSRFVVIAMREYLAHLRERRSR